MTGESNQRKRLDDYAEAMAGSFSSGPYELFRRLVPRSAEPLVRLRFHLERMRANLPFEESNEGEDAYERAIVQLDRIQNDLLHLEGIGKTACNGALGVCQEWGDYLYEHAVKANCALAEAESEIARLKDRLRWFESQREQRLQEHSPASPDLRARVLALTGGKCAYCDSEITADTSDGKPNFVIEHVVPKSCGGPDHFSNYVPACSKCNYQKSTGHVLEFIQRRLISARVEIAEAAE